MIQFLFSNWITHFINSLSTRRGISSKNKHLLIVDDHNSYVTLEVVMKAMEVGLDLVTLPCHTSHHLQSLDVCIFAPYKKAFKHQKDAWILRQGCRKTNTSHMGVYRTVESFDKI